MAPKLTRLQQIILEIEPLGLPLRDAVRVATQQVGFFVGQQRYIEERLEDAIHALDKR